MKSRVFLLLLFLSTFTAAAADLLAPNNLAAWCIVPFDSAKRGPAERAAMLEKLGITKLAYDWRAEHVSRFDAECDAMKKHDIELFAWWFPGSLNGDAQKILDVIARHKIHPQLWVTGGKPAGSNDTERIANEVARIKPIALAAAKLRCKVALYNHGDWFGQPENQIEIIRALERDGIQNVGIAYNFHHGHEHLPRFGELVTRMKPYLLAVNINGMVRSGSPKIIDVGLGDQELEMIRFLISSGWKGPVGILNHRTERDAEVALRENLRGAAWIRAELKKAGSGGPKPTASAGQRNDESRFGRALDARVDGKTLDGRADFRELPLTIECWVKLQSAKGFNIFAAHDQKASRDHWELYSYSGKGDLSVYLPGRGGEFRSGVVVTDNQWHYTAAQIETNRVRIYLDGKLVLDRPAQPQAGRAMPGPLVIGKLIEGSHGCDGLIDDLRISRGVRAINVPQSATTADAMTLGLWNFDEEPTATQTAPSPAPHFYPNAPVRPDEYPNRTAFVNRDRVYDFYEKQARAFTGAAQQPALLASYPGMDGGRFGHWGNQNEDTWKSVRWAEMDHGSMTAGIFRGNKLTIPRAVCVYLGGPEQLSAVLDLETMSWPAAWKGGFVTHNNVRNGFMAGPSARGTFIEPPASEPLEKDSFTYRGLHRVGSSVVFEFEKDGKVFHEQARAENGKVVRTRSIATQLPKPESRWPQWFETKGERGEGETYALDTVALPTNAPWKSGFHFDGLDFFADGTAALSTFEGEVWLVRGLDDKLKNVRWKRFAMGIHQGLGLRVIDGKICVLGRDQITRLHDVNGDDEADFYENISNAYETPLGGHDYVTGLERDAEGRWYIASGKQGVFRTTPDQKGVEILATGFRNPNGVALGPKGEVIVAVNEGEWTPTSWLTEIIPGVPHYGARGPTPGALPGYTLPTLYLPRGVDNSCGGQVFTSGDRWGVPAGSLVHLSYGAGSAFIVLRETVNGLPQGCAMQIPADFRSGATRARTNPKDGQLYVAGMFGWGCYTPDEGCFQRVRFTGGKQQAPVAFRAHANGIRLEFAKSLPRDLADAKRWFAQAWNYRMSAAYGSDEWSLRWPKEPGHDVLKIEKVHRLDDGKTLFIEIPDLEPCNQLHLFADTTAFVSPNLYLTLNNLSPDFTGFDGYVARARTRPLTRPLTVPADNLKPVEWETGAPGRALLIQAGAGLQYAQKELRAKAGERISLTFENPDVMPHNFVLTKIGADAKVGELSNQLIMKPEALAQHYVPQTPDVIVHTRLVNPDASCTIHFNAPAVPGAYPYLCTFPGHWQVMKGLLVVE